MTAAYDLFVRELHASSRSHVYLALDGETPVVLKTPSIDLRHDAAYLELALRLNGRGPLG